MASQTETVNIEGQKITLSNLDKVLYPAIKFTKRQIIDYYLRVAAYLLPHLKDRPITLKRYPDGVRGEFFYEKNAPKFTPLWVRRFSVPRRRHAGEIQYILINDLPTLVWVANTASLELHPFLHRVPKISVPTEIVFDFDPGEGSDILTCAQAACLFRDVLAELKLTSFPKVSGSKGLQVYVPLNGDLDYEIVKPFVKTLAQLMEQRHPDLLVSKMSKNLRSGKVFIDWSQNTESKTTVSVYSLRAKSDEPYVSLPVIWDELENAIKAKDPQSLFFGPEEALKRLNKTGDLFVPVEDLKQNLPVEIVNLVKQSASPKSLGAYRQKRNFAKTSEPPPLIPERNLQGSTRRFVIQKHAASHLHYDFRLEMHGVLKSWAVPKGPPLSSDEKRLAMPTEDHPIDYLSFEGIIPHGQYGGGTVMVWDIGTYELIEGNVYKGYLKFHLSGKKLKGEWMLTRSSANGDRPKWYLIKADSRKTHASKTLDDRSALSGRTMAQIAAKPEREWQSNRTANSHSPKPVISPSKGPDLSSFPKSNLAFVSPMLAQPVSAVPKGNGWQYEIKLDGYRAVVLKRDSGVTVFSRRGNKLNQRFLEIAGAFSDLPSDTILDGEIVALDKEGRPQFNLVQHAKPGQPFYFYAFDVLAYKSKDVLTLPLSERRQVLELALRDLQDPIRLLPTFDFDVDGILRAIRENQLEGVIAKRTDSKYAPGQRNGAWVKYKTPKGQELVIGGYLPENHSFDSLLVGHFVEGKLMFLGKVRNGFTPRLRAMVLKKLRGLETEKCPFANLPEAKNARRGRPLTKNAMKECHWLKPKLVAQVEFTDWTAANHLRHSRFAGLR